MKKNFLQHIGAGLKPLLVCAALFAVFNQTSAQVCSSPGSVIYSLSNAGGIYPITVSNANVGTQVNATLYGTSTSANSIGYNTANGLFYFFQVAISGTKTFVSYNPSTSVYKTLAASPIAATVNRGCVSFDGSGYYCLDVNGNLYYYNISLNTWALVCSTFKDQSNNTVTATFTSESSGDMAIDGYGNLWIVCSNGSTYGLYEMAAPLATTTVVSITLNRIVASTTATPAGIGFTGIAFDPSGNLYMATSTDLYIMKAGFALTHLGAFSVANVSGDLTSCSYPYNVLAVEWESVNVISRQNKSVDVSWSVSQQTNNKGYFVERSADGTTWDELGFIANSGTTENTAQYSFTDNDPFAGKSYYRICEVDMDGTETYSEIKFISVANSSTINVWPNPAKDVIDIQNSNETSGVARIYNLSGSLVSENKLQAGMNTINITGLTVGMYIVNISAAGGQSYNKKIIKQ